MAFLISFSEIKKGKIETKVFSSIYIPLRIVYNINMGNRKMLRSGFIKNRTDLSCAAPKVSTMEEAFYPLFHFNISLVL